MRILSATGGLAGTNCYLVVDEETQQCVLFDAPDHTVTPLLNSVRRNGWDLIGLWLTHGHFDHVADHQIVRDAFPKAMIKIHAQDEDKLRNPNTRFFQLPFTIPSGHADSYIEEDDVLRIGTLACRVLYTPGHAPGHVCYHFADSDVLVGGDLIIGGAVGRYDLPDSNLDDLCASVRKVMKLSPKTRLLPGHGLESTLGEEAAANPYVRQIMGTA